MNASQPPRFGRLILERLGPRNDSIVGDLTEEWHAGRSALWYWRQVVVAVAFQIVADARQHWTVVVRGVLTGLLVLYALGWIVTAVTAVLTWLMLLHPSGVILMQFQVGFLIQMANSFCGSVVAGWVIARLHDRHRAVVILSLVLILGVLAVSNGRFYFLVRNSLGHERFVPYLLGYLIQCGVVMTGVLIGGLVPLFTASRRAVA
jgi:hypothetical protein